MEFHFGKVVTEISHPKLVAGGEEWTAEQILVCSGADFETLYPSLYAASGITKVKLQMMCTAPQPRNWRLGPSLCAGLTLTHYTAFAHCPSLPALKARITAETPHFPEWGIHVMASQNALGEVVIGDSHEHGLNPEPFDKEEINDYVLDYLKNFAKMPSLAIAEKWHGVYAKFPGRTEFVAHPESGVTISQCVERCRDDIILRCSRGDYQQYCYANAIKNQIIATETPLEAIVLSAIDEAVITWDLTYANANIFDGSSDSDYAHTE